MDKSSSSLLVDSQHNNDKNDDKKENHGNNASCGGDGEASNGSDGDAGSCVVVKRLIQLLQQQPKDLEITILDPCHCRNGANNNDDDDDGGDSKMSSPSSTTNTTTLSDKKRQKQAKKNQMKKLMTTGCKNIEHLLVLQEGHLGVDAIAFPWMTRLIRDEYKRHKEKRKRSMQQKEECQDTTTTTTTTTAKQYWIDMYWITSCLLLVNPDHTTVWADKRRALQQLVSSSIPPSSQETLHIAGATASSSWLQQEYQFVNLLMTQHSKA